MSLVKTPPVAGLNGAIPGYTGVKGTAEQGNREANREYLSSP
jgi:hypothetical protein